MSGDATGTMFTVSKEIEEGKTVELSPYAYTAMKGVIASRVDALSRIIDEALEKEDFSVLDDGQRDPDFDAATVMALDQFIEVARSAMDLAGEFRERLSRRPKGIK
jgi:hypothetical protein